MLKCQLLFHAAPFCSSPPCSSASTAGAKMSAPEGNSTVALVKGDSRRKNIEQALTAIDDKSGRPEGQEVVVIKVNNVSTVNQLAATHADAIHGILDYLEPRFKGPVVIAESSAGDTLQGFEQFGYNRLATERRSQKVR